MFLVGGGIIAHAIPWFHHFTEDSVEYVEHIPTMGSIIGAVTPTLINLVIGFIAGLLVFIVIGFIQKIRAKSKQA